MKEEKMENTCIEEATNKTDSSKNKSEEEMAKAKVVEFTSGEKDSKTKSKDNKSSEPSKKKGKEFKPPTKVVVRRLPPSMTEEEFLQQVDPLPPVDFKYYVQADNSLAPNNFCRAYLNFVNQADIFIFTQKFDNYVFVDSKGMEYPAVVEFAPFQRIPKQRPNKKKDSKSGTLASDPFYVAFLEKLEAEAQEMSSASNNAKQHFFETNVDTSEVTKVSSTPLLDFLHNKYQERRRLKEEKRKKDIERKKAKDEIKKAVKKDEESPPTVKVLHGNAAGKDRLKDKENSRPASNKKRNDERVKENKVRVGKSYQDEKQKQLEKREEQKRKLGLGKSQKSSNDDKKEEDLVTKDSEDNKDEEEKDTENTTEKVQEDRKDSNSGEKSASQKKQYTSGQAYQEYQEAQRAKREEERRRYREERALKRKEERLRNKKAAAERKPHDKDDRYKDRGGSGSFKGPPSNSYSSERKARNLNSSRSEDVVEGRKYSEKNTDSTKDSDKRVGEPIGSNKSSNKNGDFHSSNRLDSKNDVNDKEIGDSRSNVGNERVEAEADADEAVNKKSELERLSSVTDTETLDREKTPEGKEQKTTSIINDDAKNKASDAERGIDGVENRIKETVNGSLSNEDKKEECIKRRNSLAMYEDGKEEQSEKNKQRESGRRNSLESGDQNVPLKPLRESKDQGKEPGDSKERLKDQGEDPRTKRRIRNKDRPSIEIYRPGMGRFSKQRLERDKVGSSTEVDSPSNSPSPTPTPTPKLRQARATSYS